MPLAGLEREEREPAIPRVGIAAILITGALLGVCYNWFGLNSPRVWGLPWIAEDRLALLQESEMVADESGAVGDDGNAFVTHINDPLAVPAEDPVAHALPEIPAVGRPVQIELGALKRYVDADAALIVDAREPEEYAEAHLPGAISLPYDVVATDPQRLEGLDTGGRPIITYCGGGSCEVSLSVAYELFYAGHDRIAVYVGGMPEWIAAGYPVVAGADEGATR